MGASSSAANKKKTFYAVAAVLGMWMLIRAAIGVAQLW